MEQKQELERKREVIRREKHRPGKKTLRIGGYGAS